MGKNSIREDAEAVFNGGHIHATQLFSAQNDWYDEYCGSKESTLELDRNEQVLLLLFIAEAENA